MLPAFLWVRWLLSGVVTWFAVLATTVKAAPSHHNGIARMSGTTSLKGFPLPLRDEPAPGWEKWTKEIAEEAYLDEKFGHQVKGYKWLFKPYLNGLAKVRGMELARTAPFFYTSCRNVNSLNATRASSNGCERCKSRGRAKCPTSCPSWWNVVWWGNFNTN